MRGASLCRSGRDIKAGLIMAHRGAKWSIVCQERLSAMAGKRNLCIRIRQYLATKLLSPKPRHTFKAAGPTYMPQRQRKMKHL